MKGSGITPAVCLWVPVQSVSPNRTKGEHWSATSRRVKAVHRAWAAAVGEKPPPKEIVDAIAASERQSLSSESSSLPSVEPSGTKKTTFESGLNR